MKKRGKISVATLVVLLVSNGVSFFTGVLITLHMGMQSCPTTPTVTASAPLRGLQKQPEAAKCEVCKKCEQCRKCEQCEQCELCKPCEQPIPVPASKCEVCEKCEECELCKPCEEPIPALASNSKTDPLFPPEVTGFVTGMMHTSKEDFASHFDMGVPLDLPKPGLEDVLILYNKRSMPDRGESSFIGPLSTEEAVQNCDFLNIVLTSHDAGRKQCVAIVPQYESYHIQKWMRINTDGKRKLDSDYPLRFVSRGHQTNGKEQFDPPRAKHTQQHWGMLRTYLASIDAVLEELKPIVEKISVQNTVIIMVWYVLRCTMQAWTRNTAFVCHSPVTFFVAISGSRNC